VQRIPDTFTVQALSNMRCALAVLQRPAVPLAARLAQECAWAFHSYCQQRVGVKPAKPDTPDITTWLKHGAFYAAACEAAAVPAGDMADATPKGLFNLMHALALVRHLGPRVLGAACAALLGAGGRSKCTFLRLTKAYACTH
jgi:hypothetical protein